MEDGRAHEGLFRQRTSVGRFLNEGTGGLARLPTSHLLSELPSLGLSFLLLLLDL